MNKVNLEQKVSKTAIMAGLCPADVTLKYEAKHEASIIL